MAVFFSNSSALFRTLTICCCLAATAAAVGAVDYPATPLGVVEKYVQEDANGAWLTELGRHELQKYTIDKIYVATIIAPTIITKYKITSSKIENNSAFVDIEYHVIGYSENLGTFHKRSEISRKTVEVQKSEGRWLIVTQIFPHMTSRTVVEQMRKAKRQSLEFLKGIPDERSRQKYEKQIFYENQRRDDLIQRIEKAAAE